MTHHFLHYFLEVPNQPGDTESADPKGKAMRLQQSVLLKRGESHSWGWGWEGKESAPFLGSLGRGGGAQEEEM